MNNTMISIQNLTFSYGSKGAPLFAGLSCTFNPGTCCGLLGKNGAGKTTLIKVITGLRFARSGAVSVLGRNPGLRDPAMLAGVFIVAEDAAVPPVSVSAFVDLYGALYPHFDRSQMQANLAQLEVPGHGRLNTFSFGQKKKFLLAFGLAANCPIFILDEPTNGLDIPSKTQLRAMLASGKRPDRTIIVSTHQVRDVEGLIDSVILLDQGKIILSQTLAAIASRVVFSQGPGVPANETVIYSEAVPGGYSYISANPDKRESRIDLEALFNAAVSNRPTVTAALAGGAA
jgi:ABC-2 type transport system ATP-binding protein